MSFFLMILSIPFDLIPDAVYKLDGYFKSSLNEGYKFVPMKKGDLA